MTDTNAGIALIRFRKIPEGPEFPCRAYQKIIEEAIQIIEELQKSCVRPVTRPKNSRTDENFTMAKILQEIQTLKSTITLSQNRPKFQSQTWANVVKQSDVAGTTTRITDEEEKRMIAQLSSEEVVKKIGVKEVIGARLMINRKVKVFFAGEETRQLMEKKAGIRSSNPWPR